MPSDAPEVRPGRPLLRTTRTDRYFDYCLQPYEPPRSPAGKLRSENLLWLSLDVAGAAPVLEEAILAIQRSCGRDLTVFGVKHFQGRLFWELYFYDPQKGDPRVTAGAIAATLRPHLSVEPVVRETVPYFMFSLDLNEDVAASRRVDTINLYLAAREAQAGRSYRQTGARLEFENIYRFLHPKKDIEKILHGIRSSVFIDFTRVPLSKVLLPELFSCNRICVAKKRERDGIYYSGITAERLLWFLRRFEYPAVLTQFVEHHLGELDHLLFDVGLDYELDADGRFVMNKTSFYGTV